MVNDIFWDLFEKSGNIYAYLAYKNESFFMGHIVNDEVIPKETELNIIDGGNYFQG